MMSGGGQHERWIRAEALVSLGRDREALTWYGTFGAHTVFDLPYLGPAHLRQATIHERLGERELAISHYREFLTLRIEAEKELQSYVDQARDGLDRLGVRVGQRPAARRN